MCAPAGFLFESAPPFDSQQGFGFWDRKKRCRGALCGCRRCEVRVQRERGGGVFGRGSVGVMCVACASRGRVLGVLMVLNEFLSELYHYVCKGTKWSFWGLRVRFTWFAEVLEYGKRSFV